VSGPLDDRDLVALLLSGYAEGIFPMAESRDGSVFWVRPQRRGVIPLKQFHVPRRLAKTMRRGVFEIRVNSAFDTVVRACAEREETWISPTLQQWYHKLHVAGHAHSVEAWHDDGLAGGLFGVTLGGLFAGESMFTRVRDASKVALAALVARLRQRGFVLLDCQFYTQHLGQFGAVEIDDDAYRRQLRTALQHDAHFDDASALEGCG